MILPIVIAAALFLLVLVIGLFVAHGGKFGASPPAERSLLRACPLCGHSLKIGENILAERTGMVREGREKIVIKGCPHCLGAEKILVQ